MQAISTSTTSRRALLGAASALPLAVVPIIARAASPDAARAVTDAATAAHPDAALIATAEEYRAAHAEMDRLNGVFGFRFGTPESLAHEQRVLEAANRVDAVVGRAAQVSAQTFEGLKAKAQIVQHRLHVTIKDFELQEGDEEIELVFSLAADIMRMGAVS